MWKILNGWWTEQSRRLTEERLSYFAGVLQEEEYSSETIHKYLRAAHYLSDYAGGRLITKKLAAAWKAQLEEQGFAPRTINAYIAGANRLFAALRWNGLHLKALRIQESAFRSDDAALSRTEYERMVAAAGPRGRLMLMTLGSTGIRESELQFFTVEEVRQGRVRIRNKGKTREILLPGLLRDQLMKYCQAMDISSGPVFRTRSGMPLHRTAIWSQIKRIGIRAKVEQAKAFPHNFRKFFACTWYRKTGDIAGLAALMGHSSINTTRIYVAESGSECRRRLDELHLVWE